MKHIDLENWYRKDFYNFYTEAYDIPLFHVFSKIDVTNVYNFAKKHDISFYFALGHIFHTALSDIEEFNIRVIDNKLIVEDCNEISFICLLNGEKMFKIISLPYQTDIVAFCKNAKNILDNQKEFIKKREENKILEYITCQPWRQCQITNPYNLNKNDFITRLSWDKIETDKNGNKTVNVSFGANHRVIDGLLVSKAFEKVEEIIKNLK